MNRIVVDIVVLAAVIDTNDTWHITANALNSAIETSQAELFLMNVVVNETISVLMRRLHEQNRISQLGDVFERLEHFAPSRRITWLSTWVERLYPEILGLIRQQGN